MDVRLSQFLEPGAWLNDEVINLYFECICKRYPNTVALDTNTRFDTRERVARVFQNRAKLSGVNLERVERILVPHNVGGNHWILIAAVRRGQSGAFDLLYLDSLPRGGLAWQRLTDSAAGYMRAGLAGLDFRIESVAAANTPQQENAFDCGVFVCMYAERLAACLPIESATQAKVGATRHRIRQSLTVGRIERMLCM